MAYEPSGEDFLSPCLAEADAMRRVLPARRVRPMVEGVHSANSDHSQSRLAAGRGLA